MKAQFKETELDIILPISGDIRTLNSELNYYSEIVGEWITIPVGVRTDFGSVPKFLQGVFPKDGKAVFAYILHDYLYQEGMYNRQISDKLLVEAMKLLGVKSYIIFSVSTGLRVGGWKCWNKLRAGAIDC